MLKDCAFMEIPCKGPKLTWSRHFSSDMIAERIDRGVANKEWLEKFSYTREHYLTTTTSDHLPLLFAFKSKAFSATKKNKLFRFENMWVRHIEREDVIKGSWQMSSKSYWDDLVNGVKTCIRSSLSGTK